MKEISTRVTLQCDYPNNNTNLKDEERKKRKRKQLQMNDENYVY